MPSGTSVNVLNTLRRRSMESSLIGLAIFGIGWWLTEIIDIIRENT